jgi:hypothetical protein
MEEIFNLIKEYPKAGASGIAIVSGSLGWLFNNIFQIYIEKIRYKKEIRTYFWKEKLNSAKKASEFYLEYLNFLNLLRHQFETYEIGKIEHRELLDNIQSEVHFYFQKLKAFPHFEYHHINLFFDFNDKRTMEINSETTRINQQILDLRINENDDIEMINNKVGEIKKLAEKLKNNYAELFDINKKYLDLVRIDIKEFI